MERNAMPARRRLALAALIVAAARRRPPRCTRRRGNGRRGPSSWWCRSRPEAAPTRSAGCWRSNWPGSGPDRHRREQGRRQRQYRLGRGGQGRAGRLHAAAVGRGLERHQLRALRQHALPRQRLRACLAAGHRPQRAGGGAGFPGKTFADFIRLARESGQVHPRQLGQRLVRPPGHGNAQAAGQDRSGARAVQGRRGGHHGPAGRSRDGAVPNQDTLLPQVQAGSCGRWRWPASAQSGVSRHADGGGVRLSGLRGRILVRPVGAGQDAARRDPAPEQATAKAMASAEMRQKLESVGFVVVGSDPQAYSGFVTSEIAKWGQAAKASGARMD